MSEVFSACAEMFLCIFVKDRSASCLLCMRRDVSNHYTSYGVTAESSLHAQRCFFLEINFTDWSRVFSACAEMFHAFWIFAWREMSLLCMRRDVSDTALSSRMTLKSSLHAQRCFCLEGVHRRSEGVFSACAEMFPLGSLVTGLFDCLLCMRRDVS